MNNVMMEMTMEHHQAIVQNIVIGKIPLNIHLHVSASTMEIFPYKKKKRFHFDGD